MRASVAGLLRAEDYLVLEVRNIGEALAVTQWYAGDIGLLLADRDAWTRLPGEYRERTFGGEGRASRRLRPVEAPRQRLPLLP